MSAQTNRLSAEVAEQLAAVSVALERVAAAWGSNDQAAFDQHDGMRRAFGMSLDEVAAEVDDFVTTHGPVTA